MTCSDLHDGRLRSPCIEHFIECFSFFLFLSPLTFFGLPLFLFLFLCLSLSLVFLSSFLSFFLFFFLFLSLFHFSFFFGFASWKEQHEKFNSNLFFSEIFSLSFGFLSCFFFPIPFSYLCFFLILSYVVCSTSMFLVSKNKVEKHQFLVKRGVATNGFLWTCVIVFCPFLPNFVDVQKHYKNRYFSTLKKTKKCILRCYYLGQVGVIIWAKLTAT